MSQLSSLFSPSEAASEPLTSSLFQPKPRKPPAYHSSAENASQQQGNPQDGKLVVANTTVSLFYFNHQSNQYDSYGKTGLCIIVQNGQFSLLLYRSNEDHISETRITKDFKFFLQNGNYGSFYDNENRLVSCLFSSEGDAHGFAKKIGIVKFVAAGRQSVVYVDLNEGKGDTLKVNDKIGIKYTGMFLADTQPLPSMGSQFDSNRDSSAPLLSFKIGHGKVVKGMDEGVQGMKTQGNASRLIIIPSHLAYGERGAPPQVPPNATLCFLVDVVKAKKSSKSGVVSETSSQKNAQDTSESDVASVSLSVHNGGEELNVLPHPSPLQMHSVVKNPGMLPLEGNPIGMHSPHDMMAQLHPLDSPSSQSLNTQKSKKPNGKRHTKRSKRSRRQKSKRNTYDSDDSSEDDHSASEVSSDESSSMDKRSKSTRRSKSNRKSQAHSDTETSSEESHSSRDEKSSKRRSKSKSTKKSKKQKQQEVYVAPKGVSKNTPVDASAALLSRLQKIEEKIDELDLSDLLKTKDTNRKMIYMSGPVLMQNMQHIISENESLRNDLADEKEKVDKLVERMRELKERNNSLTKHSFTFTQDDDFLQGELMSAKKQVKTQQATILQMTEQVEQLTEDRNNLKEQTKKLTEDLDDSQQSKMYFEAKVGNLESDIGKLNQKLREMLEQIEMAKNQSADLTDENHAQTEEINRLQNKLAAEIKARENTQDQLKESQQTIHDLLEDREEKSNTIDGLKQKLRELVAQITQEREEQDDDIEQLKKEYESQQSELKDKFMSKLAEIRAEGEEETAEQASSAVKLVMKQIYGNVNERIPHPESRYRGEKLLSVLLDEVKGLTQQFLQHIDAGGDVESFEYEGDEHDELSDDEPSEEEQRSMASRFPSSSPAAPAEEEDESSDEEAQEENKTNIQPADAVSTLPIVEEGEEEDITLEQEGQEPPMIVTDTEDTDLDASAEDQVVVPQDDEDEDDLYVNNEKNISDGELEVEEETSTAPENIGSVETVSSQPANAIEEQNDNSSPLAEIAEQSDKEDEQPETEEFSETQQEDGEEEQPANPEIQTSDSLSSGAIIEEKSTVEQTENVHVDDPLASPELENMDEESAVVEDQVTAPVETSEDDETEEIPAQEITTSNDVVKDTTSEVSDDEEGQAGLVGGEDSEEDEQQHGEPTKDQQQDEHEEVDDEDEAAQQDILADFDDAQKEEEDTAKGSTIENNSGSYYDRPMTDEERQKRSVAASSLFSDLDDDDFF